MNSSSLSHTKWKCQYHIVFIPKYRRKVLYGQIKADVREILKKLWEYKNIEIVEGAICADHVHLCVSIPPKLVWPLKGANHFGQEVMRLLCINSGEYHWKRNKEIYRNNKK